MEEDCIKILSPSTELELRKLVTDNCVCGLGCCLMSIIGIFVVLGVLSEQSKIGDIIIYLCIAWLVPFVFVSLFALVLNTSFLDEGKGDIVGGWCRNKVFAALLMINIFNLFSSENRCSTLRLMQRIKQEFEDPELKFGLIPSSASSSVSYLIRSS